jgi:hypothetical protein
VMSNNISGVLTLSDVDVVAPVDPMPFGADTAFASYLGTSATDDLSALSAVFSINFTDVESGESTTFEVNASGNVGQNATAVSFFGGPDFGPDISFVLGTTKYTISDFRAAAGDGKTGTFAFTVNASAIPEPASMAMLAMGGLGLLGAARRRKALA